MTVQEAIELHLKPLKERAFAHTTEKALEMAIECMKEVEQYRALGTVEELKEAREKQIPKNPKSEQYFYGVLDRCPVCDVLLGHSKNYCHNCGQALKWGEEDD